MSQTPPWYQGIMNWRDIEVPEPLTHPLTKEERGYAASFSRACGLRRLGVHHQRLMPGQRTSPPHAERDEEEFVFVLEGTPDLWTDGFINRLKPGDAVGWANGTAIAHTLINNTESPVRLLVIGEASRYASQVLFPASRDLNEWAAGVGKLWKDHPVRKLGPHDGRPDAVRGQAGPKDALSKRRPSFVVRWRDVQGKDENHYPGSPELLSIGASLSKAMGLYRLGIWVDELLPGRRTSWPHAEGDEEEFVYVLEGEPDLWIDGHVYRLTPGDFVGWPDRTGIAHVLINNTDTPVRMIVAGEASRRNSRVFYPLHPERMKELGERAWVPERPGKMGPHDGMPDALRAALLVRPAKKTSAKPARGKKGKPAKAAKAASKPDPKPKSKRKPKSALKTKSGKRRSSSAR